MCSSTAEDMATAIQNIIDSATDDQLVDELIKSLEYINQCKTKPVKVFNAVRCLADYALVTSSGTCNHAAIQRVRNAGFHVYPGERDRYGWLTGCINTNVGIIVFG